MEIASTIPLHHLFGLCSILNCNIRSVYPNVDGVSKNDNLSKRLLNVTFQPRETIVTDTILIMWSKGVSPEDWLLYSDQEYWSTNHYVPLLKPRETEGDYLQAIYSVAKAVVEIKLKKEPNTDTKTTFGTMVLQGIRNVVPIGKKRNSRIKKGNAANKRGITFNVRLIKVDPDFNRKELLNKFVQDVEYILLLLGDQYSKSNIKKEIT
ncbi:unnamed protein product, partial [Didymodactylos carnosus]